MSSENDASDMRPSAPRRITLQGRTFGKLNLDTPSFSRDDQSPARTSDAYVTGPQRITDPRRSVG